MRACKSEHACKLIDVSVGGVALETDIAVEENERIIAYFDDLGGLEGNVVRLFDGGFAMRLSATLHKREKLAAQITWLINRNELLGAEERRHERARVRDRMTTLKLDEGIVIECRILDLSLSGASVGTNARPPVGATVVLGPLRCRVMRHHERGIGVQFAEMQDHESLKRHFS